MKTYLIHMIIEEKAKAHTGILPIHLDILDKSRGKYFKTWFIFESIMKRDVDVGTVERKHPSLHPAQFQDRLALRTWGKLRHRIFSFYHSGGLTLPTKGFFFFFLWKERRFYKAFLWLNFLLVQSCKCAFLFLLYDSKHPL